MSRKSITTPLRVEDNRGDARLLREMFLSTELADRREGRFALAALLVSAVIFLAAAPFAKTPLAVVPAFIPIYESALVICDLITVVLLFGQFSFLRSQALFVLASGYVFTAFMTVSHALTFPGLFSPTGLLGAGPQSTAWVYLFWHGGFPLVVIAYALLKDNGPEPSVTRPRRHDRVAILSSVAAVLAIVCGLTLFATAGHEFLPAIMQGNRITVPGHIVISSVWALSLLALAVLWRRRPHTVLDLWLMVVMCAWLFDIALAGILSVGRYDLGWYAGRIYGLLAASFVLIVLLLESGKLYARLVDAFASERQQRQLLERTDTELMAVNKDLEAFSYSVSHDLRAPLRAVNGYALRLEEDYAAMFDEEGRRLLGVVRGEAGRMGRLIDDLLAFSRIGRQPVQCLTVDMEALVRETVEESAGDYPSAKVEIAALPQVAGDRALLKQVWVNLVGNALKYSSKHLAPRVEIGGRAIAEGLEYWVKDNGAGFDPRYADKLFSVFQRLHGADEFPGTGVGLAIVQQVVARHGGRVGGEGAVDQGARFFFVLPTMG
jgi:signal transduction histidine kinase